MENQYRWVDIANVVNFMYTRITVVFRAMTRNSCNLMGVVAIL
jgi:hypothetical protein